MIIPNIWENKKWQPNHQLAMVFTIRICGFPVNVPWDQSIEVTTNQKQMTMSQNQTAHGWCPKLQLSG